jgi:hypothetical protein
MIDRIVHHADVLTLKGASYRLRGRGIDSIPQHQNTEPGRLDNTIGGLIFGRRSASYSGVVNSWPFPHHDQGVLQQPGQASS